MAKIQRRHLNYVQRKPFYRDYSIRSVKGYTDTASVVHPGDFDFGYSWDYTFPEEYPSDSVLFAKIFALGTPVVNGSPVSGAVTRRIMRPESLDYTGFSAKTAFGWTTVVDNGAGGTVNSIADIPRGIDYTSLYAQINPVSYTATSYAIVYEIDPESYFDLSA